MIQKYDLVIIGSGPGGYTAGILAAKKGLKVCVIEKESLGGTCLNSGCIPTKSLSESAHLFSKIKRSKEFGINVENIFFDFNKVIERKEIIVKSLGNGIKLLFDSNKIDLIFDNAVLEDVNDNEGFIFLENAKKKIYFNKLIIASGAKSYIPEIFNINSSNILTAKELLSLKKFPSSLLIIGGGVIGCEFASIFSSFGTKVTIIEAMDKLLVNMDKDISLEILKIFKRKKIKCLFSCLIDKVIEDTSGIKIFKKEELIETCEKILIAIGSYADISFINPKIKIEKTNKGFINIDEVCRTNIKNIYAIGDVTGKAMLAHFASYQAHIAVSDILGEKKINHKDIKVPLAIFTDPEIASVGLTEEQAEKNTNIKIGRVPMAVLGRARTIGDISGFVKIIADKNTDIVLGAHIIGYNASELIGQLNIYINKKMKINEMCDIIYVHPTMSEAIFETSLSINGNAIHLIREN